MTEAGLLVVQARKKIRDALPRDQNIHQLMANSRWQTWQRKLEKIYTPQKLMMIDGILNTLQHVDVSIK